MSLAESRRMLTSLFFENAGLTVMHIDTDPDHLFIEDFEYDFWAHTHRWFHRPTAEEGMDMSSFIEHFNQHRRIGSKW